MLLLLPSGFFSITSFSTLRTQLQETGTTSLCCIYNSNRANNILKRKAFVAHNTGASLQLSARALTPWHRPSRQHESHRGFCASLDVQRQTHSAAYSQWRVSRCCADLLRATRSPRPHEGLGVSSLSSRTSHGTTPGGGKPETHRGINTPHLRGPASGASPDQPRL